MANIQTHVMEAKVYIQAMNNFPIADWAVSAYLGFKEKQSNIIFFEDIEEVPASRNNIVVAFIEDTDPPEWQIYKHM
jgi:hypothetical protein